MDLYHLDHHHRHHGADHVVVKQEAAGSFRQRIHPVGHYTLLYRLRRFLHHSHHHEVLDAFWMDPFHRCPSGQHRDIRHLHPLSGLQSFRKEHARRDGPWEAQKNPSLIPTEV